MMVGEPLQLPAFPAAMPQGFMAQPEAAYPVPADLAQQQQQLLAAQYGLQAGLMGARACRSTTLDVAGLVDIRTPVAVRGGASTGWKVAHRLIQGVPYCA